MIGGGVAVSDDGSLVFPIFREVPEQHFASCWIEKGCCLRGTDNVLDLRVDPCPADRLALLVPFSLALAMPALIRS